MNTSAKPPNLLLIHADQHRYDCIAVHGHPLLKTPNLDRLAREGTDFRHAFTPIPICSPARASLLTGAWPTRHGCVVIPGCEAYHPAAKELPTLWSLLGAAGYRQALVGKFHNEVAGQPQDHGCDNYVPHSLYNEWRRERGIPPSPDDNGYFGEADPYITEAQSRMAWEMDQVIALIRRYHAEGRRFFVRWDPEEPHLPCRPPAEIAALYPPEAIPPWPSFPDTLEGKPWAHRRQLQMWGTAGWTWAKWQPVVARYLAEVDLLDRQLGRLLALLDELGLAKETLVAYSADHGDFCGGHGLMDKHFSMYDDIVRVPLLLRFPGHVPAGIVSEAFVSNELDLARTFLTAAGIAPPDSFVGQDLLGVLAGRVVPRADIYAQYQGTHAGLASIRMVRDAEWKYVWNCAIGADELYHLPSDPGELNNLIADPELEDQRQRLRQRLVAWMEEARDPLLSMFTRPFLIAGSPAPHPAGPAAQRRPHPR